MGQRERYDGFSLTTNPTGTCYIIVRPPGAGEKWLPAGDDLDQARAVAPQLAAGYIRDWAAAHPDVPLPARLAPLARSAPGRVRPLYPPPGRATPDPRRQPPKRTARVTSRPPPAIDPARGDEPLPELPRRRVGFAPHGHCAPFDVLIPAYIGDLAAGWRPEADDRPMTAATVDAARRALPRALELGGWVRPPSGATKACQGFDATLPFCWTRLEDLDHDSLVEWQRALTTVYHYRRTYAWGLIAHLHGFLKWAKAKNHLYRAVAMPRYRRNYRKRITRLTFEDVERFCAGLPLRTPAGHPLRVLAVLARDTGMRLGNLAMLEARDFHLADPDRAVLELRVECEKEGNDAFRPLTREAADLLVPVLAANADGPHLTPFGRLRRVPGTRMERIVPRVSSAVWAREMKRAGLLPDLQGRYGPHAIRKAVFSRWCDIARTVEKHALGVRALQEQLGCRSVETAAHYMLPRGPEAQRVFLAPLGSRDFGDALTLTLARRGDELVITIDDFPPRRLALHQRDPDAAALATLVTRLNARALPDA